MSTSKDTPVSNTGNPPADAWLAVVRQRVEELSYGSVQILVREGRVVEIESTNKLRLTAQGTPPTTRPAKG